MICVEESHIDGQFPIHFINVMQLTYENVKTDMFSSSEQETRIEVYSMKFKVRRRNIRKTEMVL